MVEEARVVVVGGGVSGLCTAHLLGKKLGPDQVLLLEAADRPGGTSRTERSDGFAFDWGPNGFLDKEPLTLQWVEELGLKEDLLQASEAAARRFIFKNERLVEIFPPPRFLLSPLLSLRGRARLMWEPLVRAKRDNRPESIWDFAARRIGKEAADTLVSSMVSGVFGGDAKQLSLEHCFPRMAEMERKHGGLVKAMLAMKKEGSGGNPVGPSGTLTSFAQGIGTLAERAAEQLGDGVRLECRVADVSRTESGYRVTTHRGESVSTEGVVLALPTYIGSSLVASLDEELSATLASIRYAHIVVVCTAYPRADVGHALDGFGYLVPRNQKKRALGCLWTSSIFPSSAPEDWVLLRTLFGGYGDPDAIDLSDEELLDYLDREVHSLLGIEKPPEQIRIYRHRNGIPQYLLNHGEILDRLAAAESRLPGLALAGNAYRGVSLNDCVLSAHRATNKILDELN